MARDLFRSGPPSVVDPLVDESLRSRSPQAAPRLSRQGDAPRWHPPAGEGASPLKYIEGPFANPAQARVRAQYGGSGSIVARDDRGWWSMPVTKYQEWRDRVTALGYRVIGVGQ